ncbi:MAG: YbaN family protein [Candidatus Bathyarchaeota archaeon]|nr:YbaN family protein [Candidatus Bathyarchaeota archaeon]
MTSAPSSTNAIKKKPKVIRVLLVIAGTVSVALGAIGVFLPILPTTPFLLLAAGCYLRSSERMHRWLLNNRWFGEYIRNYQQGKGIPMKTKIVAIAVLWLTILYSAFFVVNEVFVAQLILFAIAIGVSVHLIRLPTYKKPL